MAVLAMKQLTTAEVARQAGVYPSTLERWLARGELRGPKLVVMGKRIVRLWQEADIARIRRHKTHRFDKGCTQMDARGSHFGTFDNHHAA